MTLVTELFVKHLGLFSGKHVPGIGKNDFFGEIRFFSFFGRKVSDRQLNPGLSSQVAEE